MAGFGDRAVGAAVASFEKGATPVQRFLGVVLLVSIVSLLVFFFLTTKTSDNEYEQKYAGLEACSGAVNDGCLELVPGELKYHHVQGSQRTTNSSLFTPAGVRPTDALKVSVSFKDVAKPVEGMYLAGEFVGIQGADGQRHPAWVISDSPFYWRGLVGSAVLAFVVWVLLMILHAANPTSSEGSRRRRA